MSKIISVMFLFLILVDNFYDNAVESTGLMVPTVHVRKCRCKASPKGGKMCPKPLFPTNDAEMQELIKCLCKTKQYKFHKVCRSREPVIPSLF